MGRGSVPEGAVAHLLTLLTLTNGTATRLLTPKEALSLPLLFFFFSVGSMFSNDFPLNASFPFTLQRALLKNPHSFTQSLSVVAV